MSTVTLSQPHCAMVSAEKPLGMASQALTQALPSLRRFFSMFDEFMTAFPLFMRERRRSDHRQAGGRRPWCPVAVRVSVSHTRTAGVPPAQAHSYALMIMSGRDARGPRMTDDSALHGAGRQALDDVLLQQGDQDDGGRQRQQADRHHQVEEDVDV